MSDDEQTIRMLRDQLDRELSDLGATEAARRRLRAQLAEGGPDDRSQGHLQRFGTRMSVPLVAAVVVLAVPAVAIPVVQGLQRHDIVTPAGSLPSSPDPAATSPAPPSSMPSTSASAPVSSPGAERVPPAVNLKGSLALRLTVSPTRVAVGKRVAAVTDISARTPPSALALKSASVGMMIISWGDGPEGTTKVSCEPGVNTVAHVYRKPGTYVISVTSKCDGIELFPASLEREIFVAD